MMNDDHSIHDKLTPILDKAHELEMELSAFKVSLYQLRNEADPAKRRRYKAWTDAEEEELLRDCDRGIPMKDISARLGRGEIAVRHRAGKLGVRLAHRRP